MADNNVKILLTAVDETREVFKTASAGLEGIAIKASSAQAALAGFGISASLGGFIAWQKHIIDTADELNDMSQRVGMAAKELAGYSLAAKQSGTSLETMAKGVKTLSGYMVEHADTLKKAGINATDSSGAIKQLADVFKYMPDGIEKTALATKLFGKAGMEMIPMLNMGADGLEKAAKKSEKYAQIMGDLAPKADEFNDSLADLSAMSAGLGNSIANELLPHLNNVVRAMIEAKKEGGLLKAVWVGLGGAASEAMDAFSAESIGSLTTKLEAAKKALAARQSDARNGAGGLLNDWVNSAQLKSAQADVDSLTIALKKLTDARDADNKAKVASAENEKALSASREAAAKQAANALLQEDRVKESAKDYEALIKSIKERIAVAAAEQAAQLKLTEGEKEYAKFLAASKFAHDTKANAMFNELVALEKSNAVRAEAKKLFEEAAKAYREQISEVEKGTAGLIDETQKIRNHNYELINGKEALEALLAARLDSLIAEQEEKLRIEEIADANGQLTVAIRANIAALKDRKAALGESVVANEIHKQQEEWKKFTDDIERSLTDSLMRGFEHGESFGKNFVESLRNTLKTAALKVVVQALVSPVMGGMNAMMGGTGAVGAAQNSFGGINNLVTLGSSAYNLASVGNISGISGGSTFASAADVARAQALMTGATESEAATAALNASGSGAGSAGAASYMPAFGGALAAYTGAQSYGAAGGMALGAGSIAAGGAISGAMAGTGAMAGASGALAAMGPWGWAAMAAMAILGSMGKRGGPQQGQYGDIDSSGYKSAYTMSGGDGLGNQALAQSAYGQAAALFAMAGKDVSGLTIGQGYKLDPQGSASGVAYRNISINGKTITGGTFDGNNGGQWYGANNDSAGAGAYLAKLSTSEILKLVDAIGDPKLGETVAKLAANFTDLNEGLTKYSVAQAQQKTLAAAMMTEEERQAQNLADAHKALDSAFSALGQTVPDSTAAFRSLVQGLDLTTQAGQDTVAKLTGVADAFILVAENAKKIAQDRAGWQMKLDIAEGKYTQTQLERFLALTSTSDEATQSIMRQVWAMEDQSAAADAAADAIAAAADAIAAAQARAKEITGSAYDAYSNLLSSTGNDSAAREFAVSRAQAGYQESLSAIAANNAIDAAAAQKYIDENGGMAAAAKKFWTELGDATDAATLKNKELITNLVKSYSATVSAQNAVDQEQARVQSAAAQAEQQAQEEQARAQAAAAQAAQQAAEAQARAQQQIRDEWQRTADSILDTMRNLRGDMLGTGAHGRAALQADFTIATAAARAGDMTAAGRLPDLAKSLTTIGTEFAASRLESDMLIARTYSSLDATLDALKKFGIEIPAFAAGGMHAGGYALVGERGPEIAYMPPARIYSNSDSRALVDMSPVVAKLEAIERRLAAVESHTGHTAGVLDGSRPQGRPLLMESA